MNDCAVIQEMISAMLDGELSENERAAVEAHILNCSECAAMYADFAALSEETGEMLAEVPDSLHDKIMKGVRTSRKPKKSVLITLRPYVSAAACLVVIIGAVMAFKDGRSFELASTAADSASAPAAVYDMPAAAAEDGVLYQAESSIYGNLNDSKCAYDSPAEMIEAPADAVAEEYADEPAAEPAVPAAPAPEPENSESDNSVICNGDVYIPEIVPGDYESLTAHFLALFDIGLTANDIELEEGMELENAYIALISPQRDAVTVHAVEDIASLVSALKCRNTEIEEWPVYPSALVEFEYGGEYYCFPLYFDGEKIIVTTVERSYYAYAAVEELLSIK